MNRAEIIAAGKSKAGAMERKKLAAGGQRYLMLHTSSHAQLACSTRYSHSVYDPKHTDATCWQNPFLLAALAWAIVCLRKIDVQVMCASQLSSKPACNLLSLKARHQDTYVTVHLTRSVYADWLYGFVMHDHSK